MPLEKWVISFCYINYLNSCFGIPVTSLISTSRPIISNFDRMVLLPFSECYVHIVDFQGFDFPNHSFPIILTRYVRDTNRIFISKTRSSKLDNYKCLVHVYVEPSSKLTIGNKFMNYLSDNGTYWRQGDMNKLEFPRKRWYRFQNSYVSGLFPKQPSPASFVH